MRRWLVLSGAAGPVAGLAAAPVYPAGKAKVTSVMPVVKYTEIADPFYWPKIRCKGRGTRVSLRSIGE
jgi:hypothetical protein